MLAGMSLGTDIKRFFHGHAIRQLALVTILILPLFYGALYLWTFWSPFTKVDRIPAAVVNLDTGYTIDGKNLEIGDQVAKNLISSGQLDLKQMGAAEAHDKLTDGDIFFTVTIPENFSAAIASPATLDATQARVVFTFNDTNSYLARILGQAAASKVQNKVNAAIGQQIVTQALSAAKNAGPQLAEAVDGINELNEGMDKADGGSKQLAAGTDELNTAVDGAVDRVEALTRDGQPLAPARIEAIADTIDTIAQRIADIPDVTDDWDRFAADITAVQTDVRAQADAIDEGPVGQWLATQIRAIGNQLGAAAVAAEQAGLAAESAPPDSVVGVLNTIHDDAATLATDIRNPDSPVGRILGLLTEGGLDADLAKATGAADKLNDGANELSDGLGKLAAGTGELAGKVDTASKLIPHIDAAQSEDLATTLSEPVTIGETELSEAHNFGTGFAPFFLGMALYVGGIVLWMLLTPVQPRAVQSGLGSLRVTLASYWPALAMGIGQAIITYLVVIFGLGMKPVHPWGMLGFLFLMSATWLALIQMFNAVFGQAVGRIVTLMALMIMLVSSGGIYPVPTTALPTQWFHPFDPMTYSVNGLRQLTVGDLGWRLPQAVIVLAGIMIVSLVITTVFAHRNRRYTMGRLFRPIQAKSIQ